MMLKVILLAACLMADGRYQISDGWLLDTKTGYLQRVESAYRQQVAKDTEDIQKLLEPGVKVVAINGEPVDSAEIERLRVENQRLKLEILLLKKGWGNAVR